ncbi:MAG: hypothetical protein FJY85_16840 [Deltaproteobacteria bacterium]|nr:hypothetical protein [Deltaproteobacteria bacterium]
MMFSSTMSESFSHEPSPQVKEVGFTGSDLRDPELNGAGSKGRRAVTDPRVRVVKTPQRSEVPPMRSVSGFDVF